MNMRVCGLLLLLISTFKAVEWAELGAAWYGEKVWLLTAVILVRHSHYQALPV